MRQNYLIGAVALLLLAHSAVGDIIESPASNVTSAGSSRFLSLFSVVRFANAFCYGSNGLNGTCYTSAECAGLGGVASGSCASGFGVCCTICITTCGKTATVNNTYWGNPGYSSTYSTAGQCSLTVKTSSNICQVRLDFVNFVIADPDGTAGAAASGTATQCLTDMFTVSGQSNNVPGICGTNTNQHIYLDMTPGSSQYTLNMLLTGTSTSRSWKIRISQLPCGATYLSPDGCLQYFTTSVGTFSSFNYKFAATPAVQHLANQDYTICIRMNQGFCGICYQVCDVPVAQTDLLKFVLSTPITATAVDAACLTDWIQIPCATDHQSTTQLLSDAATGCVNKICGAAFSAKSAATAPAPVYSYRKPFEVRVFTTAHDELTTQGIGFCLKYQQLTCTSG